MTRTLCVANQKGGVGKTSTSVNLAVAIAKAGERTLLIDLDPQCNATTGLGAQPLEQHPLIRNFSVSSSVQSTEVENLELLPGSRSFQDVEQLETGDVSHASTLKNHLTHSLSKYDVVMIDCPPSLGGLTQTALSCSTEVLMPIQCEYYALEGLTQMIECIRGIIHNRNNTLTFGGIALTMYDPLLELTAEIDAEVRDFFGDIVFRTVIPRDVSIAEAPSHGLSVLDYAPRSRGSRAYTELCMEVLDRG